MKINTTNLKEYKRIYDITKVIGNDYYDHIYLDFKKEVMTFMNESSIVEIKLFLEDKNEKQENLYIDGTKFFFLVSKFDYLTVKGKVFYSPENNKFILQNLDETMQLPSKKEYEWKSVQIDFTEDFNKFLVIAKDYLDLTLETSIFFEKGSIIALSENRYFQGNTNLDKDSSFSLSLGIIKIIESLPKTVEDSCLLKYRTTENDGKIYEITFKDLVYNFASSYDNEIAIQPFSEEFIKLFKHENYFVLDLKSVLEKVKTLDSYNNDANFSLCEIKFFENSLVFYLTNKGTVEYTQEVECYSDFEIFKDDSFWISLNRFKIALSSLNLKNYEKIIVRYDKDKDMIYFSDKEESGEMYLVQTLLVSPND